VVITPNGQGDVLRHWSLDPSTGANPDVAFTQAMLRTTTGSLCIDPKRVFSTGISNGAMFSTLLACALPGRLAAIAPVSGINVTPVCAAGTPRVSVLAFHGTADPIVPYRGGAYFSGQPIGRVLGVPDAKPVETTAAAWALTAAWPAHWAEPVVWPTPGASRIVSIMSSIRVCRSLSNLVTGFALRRKMGSGKNTISLNAMLLSSSLYL
jgi:poly(3-hydroxybutyrate) depolymerase